MLSDNRSKNIANQLEEFAGRVTRGSGFWSDLVAFARRFGIDNFDPMRTDSSDLASYVFSLTDDVVLLAQELNVSPDDVQFAALMVLLDYVEFYNTLISRTLYMNAQIMGDVFEYAGDYMRLLSCSADLSLGDLSNSSPFENFSVCLQQSGLIGVQDMVARHRPAEYVASDLDYSLFTSLNYIIHVQVATDDGRLRHVASAYELSAWKAFFTGDLSLMNSILNKINNVALPVVDSSMFSPTPKTAVFWANFSLETANSNLRCALENIGIESNLACQLADEALDSVEFFCDVAENTSRADSALFTFVDAVWNQVLSVSSKSPMFGEDVFPRLVDLEIYLHTLNWVCIDSNLLDAYRSYLLAYSHAQRVIQPFFVEPTVPETTFGGPAAAASSEKLTWPPNLLSSEQAEAFQAVASSGIRTYCPEPGKCTVDITNPDRVSAYPLGLRELFFNAYFEATSSPFFDTPYANTERFALLSEHWAIPFVLPRDVLVKPTSEFLLGQLPADLPQPYVFKRITTNFESILSMDFYKLVKNIVRPARVLSEQSIAKIGPFVPPERWVHDPLTFDERHLRAAYLDFRLHHDHKIWRGDGFRHAIDWFLGDLNIFLSFIPEILRDLVIPPVQEFQGVFMFADWFSYTVLPYFTTCQYMVSPQHKEVVTYNFSEADHLFFVDVPLWDNGGASMAMTLVLLGSAFAVIAGHNLIRFSTLILVIRRFGSLATEEIKKFLPKFVHYEDLAEAQWHCKELWFKELTPRTVFDPICYCIFVVKNAFFRLVSLLSLFFANKVPYCKDLLLTLSRYFSAHITKPKLSLSYFLSYTCTLSFCFSFLQFDEYRTLPFSINTNIFGSCFYMTTGMHGLHVIGGALFLFVCLTRFVRGWLTSEHHTSFELASMYWHFVDIIWLIVLGLFYVWITPEVMKWGPVEPCSVTFKTPNYPTRAQLIYQTLSRWIIHVTPDMAVAVACWENAFTALMAILGGHTTIIGGGYFVHSYVPAFVQRIKSSHCARFTVISLRRFLSLCESWQVMRILAL